MSIYRITCVELEAHLAPGAVESTVPSAFELQCIHNDISYRSLLQNIYSTQEEYDDLVWYLETYAAVHGSPFDKARAKRCQDKLNGVKVSLLDALGIARLQIRWPAVIQVDIVGTSPASPFYSIPWELIEEPLLADSRVEISLTRRFQSHEHLSCLPVIIQRHFNILIVTARPNLQNDIDYLAISRQIMMVATELQTQGRPIRVVFGRPGTWSAFRACLNEQQSKDEMFELVHLDLHGSTTQQDGIRRTRLCFLNQLGTGPHYVDVDEVATLLCEHAVKIVVLNACRSTHHFMGSAGLAQKLLDGGTKCVVGMAYDISQMAARRFVHTFYDCLLGKGLASSEAGRVAREALRSDRMRNARFGLKVQLDDWIVPTVYLAEDISFKFITNTTPTLWSRFVGMISPRIWKMATATHAQVPEDGCKKILDVPDHFDTRPYSPLPGRDLDVMGIENLFLLPYRSTGRPALKRRIVHLHGVPSIGKTALLRFIGPWWQSTQLVIQSIYCDVERLPSLQQILEYIKYAISWTPSCSDTAAELSRHLQSHRYLLILDHLDGLRSMLEVDNSPELGKIAAFVDSLRSGNTFVITVSRTVHEPWLIVRKGRLFPIALEAPRQRSMQQYFWDVVNVSKSANRKIERQQEEALHMILDQFEYNPAMINFLARHIARTKDEIGSVLEQLRSGPWTCSTRPYFTRYWLQMAAMTWPYVCRYLKNSGQERMTVLLLLAPFQKRIPMELDLLIFYGHSRIPVEQLTNKQLRIQHEIWLNVNPPTSGSIGAESPLRSLSRYAAMSNELSFVTALLEENQFIIAERIDFSDGSHAEYWRIQPLFSFHLQQLCQILGYTSNDSGSIPFSNINYLAFMDFYNARLEAFNDHTNALATLSKTKILLELDNIVRALEIWAIDKQDELSLGFGSFMLFRLTQTFPLVILTGQDYRKVIEALQRVSSLLQCRLMCGIVDEHAVYHHLQAFLRSTANLQNLHFALDEWPQAQKYGSMLAEVFGIYRPAIDKWTEFLEYEAQAAMISAWSHIHTGAIQTARTLFLDNLGHLDRVRSVTKVSRANKQKLVTMNHAGLMQCWMSDHEGGIEEAIKISDRCKVAQRDWMEANAALDFLKGFAELNEWMVVCTDRAYSDLNESTKVRDRSTPTGGSRTLGDTSVSNQGDGLESPTLQIHAYPKPDFALTPTYTRMQARTSEAYQRLTVSKESILSSLALALYEDTDDGTVSQYYQDLTRKAISDNDYEAAVLAHQQWMSYRRSVEGIISISTRCKDEYLCAMFALQKRDLPQADLLCAKALKTSLEARNFRVHISCLHIAADLHLKIRSNVAGAMSCLIQAGAIAYDLSLVTGFGSPGSIIQGLLQCLGLTLGTCHKEDISCLTLQTNFMATLRSEHIFPGLMIYESFAEGALILYAEALTIKYVGDARFSRLYHQAIGRDASFRDDSDSILWHKWEAALFDKRSSTTSMTAD